MTPESVQTPTEISVAMSSYDIKELIEANTGDFPYTVSGTRKDTGEAEL